MNRKHASRLKGGILIGVMLLSGCGFFPGSHLESIKITDDQGLETQLDAGERLFAAGNYPEAEKTFSTLQDTGEPLVERRAIYGLACTRLALAESRQDIIDAVALFQRWQGLLPETYGPEDPRMLLPALLNGAVSSDAGGNSKRADASAGTKNISVLRCFDYEKEIGALHGRLREMEKKIQKYKSKEAAMRVMEKELVKLRDQIKSFESIDQKIQEKKQGISSP